MAGDIKQRIVLEGEKEYSAALKDAQRNLKVLRSELKAETAELGKNATEQQKNETRMKNLQKQIKEQEKVVRTYEKALKEVRERYGDNEEAVAKWEVKLNDARTALATMKNTLDDTGRSLKNVGISAQASVVAANSLAESFGKIADVGNTLSGAIEKAFSGIVGTIGSTIAQVWASITDLAARSNNLVDLAGFWGTDAATIQKWQGAVASASANLEDLNALVTKINSMDGNKIAELTGVSDENYTNMWDYAMAVMDAMSKMNTQQRNEAGFGIFGKSATKAFDLLNDWETVLAHLDEYNADEGGYGLTTEELQSMSELGDMVSKLRYDWQALKDMATVHLFGELAMEVTGNVQNILDAFKDYFQADDDSGRAEALEKIKDNMRQIFEKLADGIREGLKIMSELAAELQNSDDPVLKAIGSIMDKLVAAFEWIANPDNWGAVVTGFKAIIAVWAGGKALSAAANLASFGSNVATILAAKGAAGAAAAGGSGITLPAAVPAAANATAKVASGGAGNILGIGTLAAMVLGDTTEAGRRVRDGGGLNGFLDGMKQDADALVETVQKNSSTFADDWAGVFSNIAQLFGGGSTVEQGVWNDQAIRYAHAMYDNWYNDEVFDQLGEMLEEAVGSEEYDRFFDMLLQYMQSEEDVYSGLFDLPADWWQNGNLTGADIQGFNQVPAAMVAAVREGASAGVSNIQVQLDGVRVGRLVSPYVSQNIARDVLMPV